MQIEETPKSEILKARAYFNKLTDSEQDAIRLEADVRTQLHVFNIIENNDTMPSNQELSDYNSREMFNVTSDFRDDSKCQEKMLSQYDTIAKTTNSASPKWNQYIADVAS